MRIWNCIFVLMIVVSFANAQDDKVNLDRSHLLAKQLQEDSLYIYRNKKIKPYFNLDLTNAYIGNSFLSLAGLRMGLILKNHHTFGLGIYTLNKSSIFKSDKVKTYQFDKLTYLSFFYEYLLLDRKYFDLLLPVEIGYGYYSASLTSDSSGTKVSSTMMPFIAGAKFIFMPHKWVGIKLGAGYRYVWENSSKIGLDGPYFSVGLRIDIDKCSRDLKYHRAKRKYKMEMSSL